ncbi:hypothetical protein LTR74_015642 [Friedmanniomyces endolithicus]|nr:hypothetical protein LTR74_015642 [Friedmanniomyces endolithicus]
MAITNPSGGPTPPQEDHPNTAYASYVPHDLAYSAAFEDSLMLAALDPEAIQDGIRVLPDDSTEQAETGVSVRASDVSLLSLPTIAEDELPLPLNDPRRVFESPVAGVKLTHPGGYLEGGPGLAPEMDTFPDDYFLNHPEITTAKELRGVVGREVEASVEVLKERLRARKVARERNEGIAKQLQTLREAHDMELWVHEKMAGVYRVKREARVDEQSPQFGRAVHLAVQLTTDCNGGGSDFWTADRHLDVSDYRDWLLSSAIQDIVLRVPNGSPHQRNASCHYHEDGDDRHNPPRRVFFSHPRFDTYTKRRSTEAAVKHGSSQAPRRRPSEQSNRLKHPYKVYQRLGRPTQGDVGRRTFWQTASEFLVELAGLRSET